MVRFDTALVLDSNRVIPNAGQRRASLLNQRHVTVAAAVLSDPDAATAAGKPLDLGMKRLQRAIQAEQEKGRGTRDALQRAMLC